MLRKLIVIGDPASALCLGGVGTLETINYFRSTAAYDRWLNGEVQPFAHAIEDVLRRLGLNACNLPVATRMILAYLAQCEEVPSVKALVALSPSRRSFYRTWRPLGLTPAAFLRALAASDVAPCQSGTTIHLH